MNSYKDTWHAFHFIMFLLTGMLWAPIWLWRTLANNAHNRSVEINLMKQQVEEMKRINRGA